MVEVINKILLVDVLILAAGLLVLFIRPFGWDITYGIGVIAVSFVVSIILFLLKLNIVEKQKAKK